MTEFPQAVNRRDVGRPPIKREMKVTKTTVWMHREVVDRIRQLDDGRQGLSDFIRTAVDAELDRREAAAAQEKRKEGRGE